MGMMQGKVMGNSIVVMDSFALPVQGTETRVNAANEANEYMVEYVQGSEKVCHLCRPRIPDFAQDGFHRPEDWSTPSGGITPIQGTDAGSPGLM